MVVGAAVCVPVSTSTTILGTLWIFSTAKRDFTPQQTNIIEMVAGRVASDLERAMLVRQGVEGVQLIYRKLRSVLEDHGLTEIEAEGKEFDPNLHEAVMCVEGEDGIVCEEIQKGYTIRDRLLRPSMVKVGKEGGEPGRDERGE